MRALPLSLLLLFSAGSPVSAHAAEEVKVYHCRDAKGQLTLRDTPCAKGQKQESVSNMIRPRDPAKPATVRPMIVEGRAAPAAETRYVIAPAIRPIYECTAPDGERYTSESAEGNPRWVPTITPVYGYGGYGYGAPGYATHPYERGYISGPVVVDSGSASVTYRDRHSNIRIGGGRQVIGALPMPGYPASPYPVMAGGAWVRDTCIALPLERACAGMAERRDAIERRNVMRQASEREALDREAAALSSRLRSECGAR